MDYIFEDFKAELNTLKPRVRKKALEIAKQLVEKENLTAKEAIDQAIIEAEEWFYDLEG